MLSVESNAQIMFSEDWEDGPHTQALFTSECVHKGVSVGMGHVCMSKVKGYPRLMYIS